MITKLYLRRFRNYQETTLEFGPRINLIQGKNALGKTNLLEAIYLIGTGRSFRTLYLKELIQQEAPFFFLEAEFVKDRIVQQVRLSFDGQVKRLDYNHTSYAHFTNLLGLLPIVLLAPEDVAIVIGAPADRRRFLDIHLAQSDPLYVHHLSRYHKALKQRNFLLKKKCEDSLGTWETLMVVSAAYLCQRRKEALITLAPHLKRAMLELSSQQDTLEIGYLPSYTDNYLPYRSKEFLFGSTLVGPHRDDLNILINEKPARSFASQGQLRSAVAALRLAEWRQLQEFHEVPPLFCIDDFGVHLDSERQKLLFAKLTSFGQVFLTSPTFFETLDPTTRTIQVSMNLLRD